MTKFSYKAKEGPNKIIDGVIDSENLDQAIRKIIKSGLTPIDVDVYVPQSPAKALPGAKIFIKKIKLTELASFSRQMADLVDAAVPILRALQLVAKQIQNPHFKVIVEDIYNIVKDGGSFSTALARHPQIFSVLYVNLVKTGEVSGELEIVLNRLADHLEKEQDIRNKISAALAYPILVMVIGAFTVFVLLSFVIPRLTVMFDDLDQELPLPTQILVTISSYFSQYWWLLVLLAVLGFIYLKQYASSEKGIKNLHQWVLTLPLVGHLVKTVEVGRFARTMATLVESGVVITTALNSVWATLSNVVLKDEIKKVSEEVANGMSLKKALGATQFFPEMAINMISVGEETGRLEKGLLKIAETYERESEQAVRTFISLLGPLVLVVIVALVGFVVVAMLLPIFKMNLIVQ